MILHNTTTGEGEPIVLIHSGGMTSLTEFEEQTEYLSARNFKVIRPDLRGHGKSNGKIDDYFTDCVKDLKDTLDSLNVEKCHIAGVSLGGIAALLLAKAYPNKVKSLTFSGVFPVRPNNWSEMLREEAANYEQLFNNEEAVSYLNEIHEDNDWKTLLKSFSDEDFYPFEQTGEVSQLAMPTLYMVGEQQDLEVSAAITYKQFNPKIHTSVIPLAGHLVHREQPDLYSRTLYAFIKEIESS
ncbi:alpha/beta fold hydrolase [Alkalibacillus haloalkaliphilus]|uniref:Alpha/beta hydrolase n=1 Tax=Alkalibacillus haloalkaliphilus TaxID=94136 RepID=A0A511W0K9_9BACI|nr:alpha/beta hydrolase [Alkalibacillus haloalkaliphilus]GEN44624.1 alpha/beta hydrolase [Alkalibacillus haloalkaliphilus]